MNIRSAKNKGLRLCNRVRQKLLDVAMTLQPHDIYVNPSSSNGPDLLLSPAAESVFKFTFECKNKEALQIWAALEQAENHAKGSELTPLLVFSRNNAPDYVALRFDDFLKLTKGNK